MVLNLRYPSHGESSASLIQAMSYGRPCVVTDHGSFSELADDAGGEGVSRRDEIDDLERAMRSWLTTGRRGRLGEAARRHVQHHHAAESVAHDYYVALARCPSLRVEPPAQRARETAVAFGNVGDYWSAPGAGAHSAGRPVGPDVPETGEAMEREMRIDGKPMCLPPMTTTSTPWGRTSSRTCASCSRL